MVLIFTNSDDYSVKIVQQWINFFGHESIRINRGIDKLELKLFAFKDSSYELILNGSSIKLTDIKSVWYRGGMLELKDYYFDSSALWSRNSTKDFQSYYLSGYWQAKYNFVDYLINSNCKVLGLNMQGEFNKLIAICEAKKVGLCVPESQLLSHKKQLLQFFRNNHNSIITKSLSVNYSIRSEECSIHGYTHKLLLSDFTMVPEVFPLSLCQTQIDKKLEVRIFYLEGNLYCFSINSQHNPKTKIDFRKYDNENMNRILPFKIPRDLKNKITNLMTNIKVNTASLDFILSKDGIFYFLEVNPIGQFSGLSDRCNYFLEKKIAEYLTN